MADTVVSWYVDTKTKALLENIAEEEHRSLSGQISYIIEKWIEDRK